MINPNKDRARNGHRNVYSESQNTTIASDTTKLHVPIAVILNIQIRRISKLNNKNNIQTTTTLKTIQSDVIGSMKI